MHANRRDPSVGDIRDNSLETDLTTDYTDALEQRSRNQTDFTTDFTDDTDKR